MKNNTLITNYKETIIKEVVNVNLLLENSLFCEITDTKSVGNYQYHRIGEFFTFREQSKILELQKISMIDFLEKLENKIKHLLTSDVLIIEKSNDTYILFFEIDKKRYKYSNTNKKLFTLLLEFYSFAKENKQNFLSKAS